MGDGDGASTAVKRTFGEFFDVITEYLVPGLGLLAGIAIALQVGGSGIIYDIGVAVNPSWSGSSQLGAAAKFITGGIYLSIGWGLYHMYHAAKAGGVGQAIYGFFAGLFGGMGLRFIGAGIQNIPIQSGWIDGLSSTVSGTVSNAVGGN